jgi:hypothetical protein
MVCRENSRQSKESKQKWKRLGWQKLWQEEGIIGKLVPHDVSKRLLNNWAALLADQSFSVAAFAKRRQKVNHRPAFSRRQRRTSSAAFGVCQRNATDFPVVQAGCV